MSDYNQDIPYAMDQDGFVVNDSYTNLGHNIENRDEMKREKRRANRMKRKKEKRRNNKKGDKGYDKYAADDALYIKKKSK